MVKTIFVQMAAYRDPELIPTLTDMISNAVRPESIRVGVCWQHGDESDITLFTNAGFRVTGINEADDRYPVNQIHEDSYITDEGHEIVITADTLVPVGADVITTIRNEGTTVISMVHESGLRVDAIDLHYHETKGACWARNSIQQIYEKEDYTLQLDSHHRFVEGWDDVCIDMLESLRSEDCPKPLLTAYIPSYNPTNDPAGRVQEPWKMDFDRFIPEGAVFFLPSTIDNWRDLDRPLRARFFSAHFAFADGIFAEEVQHDPEYFFHGEEISIAVRAYTHGYDLFHPHRLIAWHEYTREGRTKVWDDHGTDNRMKGKIDLDWVQRNDICHKRNRILFGMDGENPNQIEFGKYGFGDKRTVTDYEQYSGLSFKYRGITQEVVDRIEPPGNIPYESDEQWKEQIVRSNDLRILVSKDDLKWPDGTIPDDMDFWYVGSAREDLTEIYRKDLSADEIKKHLHNSHYADFRLIWRGNEKASKYVVWPHSASLGWRPDRIVRDVTEP